MGTDEDAASEGREPDRFWPIVTQVATRHFGARCRVERGRYLLVTPIGAILSLAGLRASLETEEPSRWAAVIDDHLATCVRLIERVAAFDLDRSLGAAYEPDIETGSALRLRLGPSSPGSVAVRLGGGWELALVIDLAVGLLPVTEAVLARWRERSRHPGHELEPALLDRARAATLEIATSSGVAAAGVAVGLTLLSAGPDTAGCLLDLDSLVSGMAVEPTLVLPLGPSVLALASTGEPHPEHQASARLRALRALGGELRPLGPWRNVPVWRFRSRGRLDIFET